MKWFDDSGRFRCKPCEMEGLCAIKTIVKGDNFRREHNKQVLEYMDFKPLDPDIMKKNIEEYYKDEG